MSDLLDDQKVEDFLSHHGVKGMHWGQRRFDNFKRNRALNRQSKERRRKRDERHLNQLRKMLRPPSSGKKLSRAQDIQRARDRISTGALKADKKAAKAQYKKDKVKIGTREARRIFRAKKKDLYKDVRRSQQAKDGWEVAQRIIDDLAADAEARRFQAERDRARIQRTSFQSQFSTTRR